MITREAEHTLRVVKFLASPEILKAGTNAMAIQKELDIPAILLRAILRRLTVAGIVLSRRGRTGGVNLAEKALKISLLDVLNAAEGAKKRNSRAWNPDAPGKAGDTVRALFNQAQAKAREVFANTTVAEIVG